MKRRGGCCIFSSVCMALMVYDLLFSNVYSQRRVVQWERRPAACNLRALVTAWRKIDLELTHYRANADLTL